MDYKKVCNSNDCYKQEGELFKEFLNDNISYFPTDGKPPHPDLFLIYFETFHAKTEKIYVIAKVGNENI